VTRPTDDNALTKAYHRLLCWDIEKAPAVTRIADKALNPLIGKSLVIYARKPFAHEQPDTPRPDRSRHVAA
jgi:hypothetical protein